MLVMCPYFLQWMLGSIVGCCGPKEKTGIVELLLGLSLIGAGQADCNVQQDDNLPLESFIIRIVEGDVDRREGTVGALAHTPQGKYYFFKGITCSTLALTTSSQVHKIDHENLYRPLSEFPNPFN
ncbi:unnamed protein product [Dovyalis caffra]|uniref:Secreted protein n=1 Tax=Dovyalis caffra TaxID=77055 RepID=A0AAV1S2Y1_9ROSI|nr:unnamed protein product [Dovyalis caffra]